MPERSTRVEVLSFEDPLSLPFTRLQRAAGLSRPARERGQMYGRLRLHVYPRNRETDSEKEEREREREKEKKENEKRKNTTKRIKADGGWGSKRDRASAS